MSNLLHNEDSKDDLLQTPIHKSDTRISKKNIIVSLDNGAAESRVLEIKDEIQHKRVSLKSYSTRLDVLAGYLCVKD